MNKSESNSIQLQVKNQYFSIFPKAGKLIVGVSGGPDSMALLYLLHKNDIPIFVVHINYGLRGEESDADQHLVEEICAMWNIECCSVKLEGTEAKGNFQDWARHKRYEIFRDLRDEMAAAGIAVAHHADDQLETILLKMLRGGGITSWQGIQVWNGELFRPLLGFSKNQILKYCEVEAIPFRKDASNQTDSYARNALRNSVFDVFEKFIPGWKSNLKEISNRAAITSELLDYILEKVSTNDSISLVDLSSFSQQLKKALLKRFIYLNTNIQLSKGELNDILDLSEAQTGKVMVLNKYYKLFKNRDHLNLKGVDHEVLIEKTFSKEDLERGINLKQWNLKIGRPNHATDLRLNAEVISFPIQLRPWKHGDIFQPFGLNGSQKISDHLTNRKINASVKEESLILIDAGGTICAILYPQTAINGENGCISDHMKISETTKNVLSISKA